jgi:8-oxo-dGTP diphosphatase
MKFDRTVAVYILNSRNQILLLKHKKLDVWLPPGGHVETNELIHEAAFREVIEESGVDIEFICQTPELSTYKDERVEFLPKPLLIQLENTGDHYHENFIYIAKSKSEEINNGEGHEIKWFSFEEALSLETFKNVIYHLDYIKRFLMI